MERLHQTFDQCIEGDRTTIPFDFFYHLLDNCRELLATPIAQRDFRLTHTDYSGIAKQSISNTTTGSLVASDTLKNLVNWRRAASKQQIAHGAIENAA
jgi:hypothetical protein